MQANTRESLVNVLAKAEVDMLCDFNHRDRWNLVLDGFKGFNDYTDHEMLDESIRRVKDCCCTEQHQHYADPQLEAMTQLLHTRQEAAERAEIQVYIDARIKEVGNLPATISMPECDDCKTLKTNIELAKREMGL